MLDLSSDAGPPLPWWPQERRGSLELDKIAAAAIDLIDEGGESYLTMRRLAERLDTAPMTIYWYVPNRDQLLALVRDHAMGPLLVAVHGTNGWRETLASLAWAMRRELVDAHPNLVSIVSGPTELPGPNALALIDRVLGALLSSGFEPADAAWAFQLTQNAALTYRATVPTPGLEMHFASVAEQYPSLAAVIVGHLESRSTDDPFAATIDATILGIAGVLGKETP